MRPEHSLQVQGEWGPPVENHGDEVMPCHAMLMHSIKSPSQHMPISFEENEVESQRPSLQTGSPPTSISILASTSELRRDIRIAYVYDQED